MHTEDTNINNLTEYRFNSLLFILRLAGHPLCMKKISKLYLLYSIVVNICFFSTALASIMDLFFNAEEIGHVMATLRVMLVYILLAWIHIMISFRRSGFEHLLRLTNSFTWEELQKRDQVTGYLTKAGWIPRFQYLTKRIAFSSFIVHTLQSSYRIIMYHDMVFNAWYPFNTTYSPIYEIIVVSQIWGSLLNTCILYGFLGFYSVMVYIPCSQLEKLHTNLLKIGKKYVPKKDIWNDEDRKQKERKEYTSEEMFPVIQEELNSCIRHHQSILQYMEELEKNFNMIMFGLFLIMLTELCSVAFSAVANWGNHADLVQSVTVYVIMMGTIYLTCTLGNDLTVQAEEIRHAAYGCQWIGTPVSFQRCITFIIDATNKEFTLTAGKFVPVSHQTMMNILQQSLSFFMFLLEMSKRNEEAPKTN